MGDVGDPRLREILSRAASLPSSARPAMLDAACADDADLRRQVELLLAALDRGNGFLENPTLGLAENGVRALCEGPGSRIGHYKLLQQIGEGGMGIVFMAEQQTPVLRRVALKIIKPGMDSRQVIARFEAERQALAVMDHPNIAHVYEAGATESGRPYFVMELVRGTPITQYCDDNELTTRQRLELLVHVCQAVQHAHTKGVIHRDLKPANVLVTVADGVPMPKIIDFGISKAIQGRLTEKTLFTEFRHLVGTPQYMSPEQADSNGVDVDTRSDVYSLGVLLYELLTGTTPLDGKELRSKAYAEMERLIRESQAPAPSTRLSTLGDAANAIAARRKTELRKLGQLLRGELDWIVLRALEKDRRRRYETANGLARDIERYLADEPVEACPPSATYRMRRFVRKHRFTLGVAAGIALVLTVATVVSSWQAVRATRAGTLARQAAARETEERKQAEAVNDVIESLFAGQDPRSPEREAAGPLQQLMTQFDKAVDSVEHDHPDEPLVRARQRVTLALAATGFGWPAKAEPLLQTALREQRAHLPPDDPVVLTTLRNLGTLYRRSGRTKEAIELLERVRQRSIEKLGPDHLDSIDAAEALAIAYEDDRQRDNAVSLLEDAHPRLIQINAPIGRVIWIQESLGNAYIALGRLADSLRISEEERDLEIAKLGAEHPYTLDTLEQIANTYGRLDRDEEKLALLGHVRDVRIRTQGPDDPRTLETLSTLAHLYFKRGRRAEAIDLLEKVRDARLKMFGPDDRRTLAAIDALGWHYSELGRKAEAMKLHEQVVEANKKQLEHDPYGTRRGLNLLWLNNLANSYVDNGRTDQAIRLLEQICDAAPKELGRHNPATLGFQYDLALAYSRAKRTDDAIRLFKKVGDQQVRILGPDHRETLLTWFGLADAYLSAARNDEAIRLFTQVADQRLKKLGPDHRDTLYTWFKLAVACSSAGRNDEAIELFKRVADRQTKLLGFEHPDTLHTLMNLAYRYQLANRNADAIKVWEQIRESILEKNPVHPDDAVTTRYFMMQCYRIAGGRGADLVRLFEPQRAELERSVDQRTAALTTRPSDPSLLIDRGGLYGRLGRFGEAANDFLRAIRLQPNVARAWHEGVPLLLWLGDADGYRRWRSKELHQFAESDNKMDGSTASKDFLILPAEPDDVQLAAKLMDRALADRPNDAWTQFGKGMAEYRRGNFDDAIRWLVKAADGKSVYRDIESNLFLAMAYDRVGKKGEAHATLAKAAGSMQSNLPNLGEGMIGNDQWNMGQDWVLCQVVRKEAESLINGSGPTTEPAASAESSDGSRQVRAP